MFQAKHRNSVQQVETVVETQQRTLEQADQREFNFTSQEFGGHMGN